MAGRRWVESEKWVGAYDGYETGRCPRCEGTDIEWGTSYVEDEYLAIPGRCKRCGQTFTEMNLADAIIDDGEDEYATITVYERDIVPE